MRVLLTDPEEVWAGGELQVELLALGLRERKVEVHMAASPTGELCRRLGGVLPILPLRMRNDLDLLPAFSVASYCREREIDVIDAHTSRAHAIGLALRLMIPRLRLVVHRHIDLSPRKGMGNRLLYLSRRVDHFVAISNKVREVLESFGVPAERITVVRSTVDPAPFERLDRRAARLKLVAELGHGRECPLIGSVAQLSPYKGHAVLLDALATLREELPQFHCVIAGEGKLRSRLESRAAELGLTKQVTFLGFRRDVPELMASFDVLAMPSLTEGLGLAILEAFLAGTVVVASATGGIPELVKDGVTGLLSPPGDARALAMNLKTALSQPDLRERLALSARSLAFEQKSPAKMVDATLEIYRQVMCTSYARGNGRPS